MLPTRTQLAESSNQLVPSTLIFALNGSSRIIADTGPDVRDPSELVLEPSVCVANHRCVETCSRHHDEALAVDPADVDRSPRAVQANRGRRRECRSVCRARSRGGWRSPRARSRAACPFPRGRRRSAAPSRLHPTRIRGRPPRREHGAPASAPCGSSAPRTRAGRRRRPPRASRRSSSRPPPIDLPECATTATRLIGAPPRPRGGRLLHLRRGTRRAATRIAAIPITTPASRSIG